MPGKVYPVATSNRDITPSEEKVHNLTDIIFIYMKDAGI